MAQAARLVSRLQRELKLLQSDPPPGVSAWPCDDRILTHLEAQIHGPQGTVYANGIFKLDIQVPERYPFEPPNIKFITPVYHPNIDNGGRICLDILNLPPKGAWRPSLNLSTLLASIGLLLAEPNPDDGLMGDITTEYKHNRLSFDVKARNWTELYANPDRITSELDVPQALLNKEPNQKGGGFYDHNQMQASMSMGKHINSNLATSSQPWKAGPSLSKRLSLDRGAACLQDTKTVTSSVSSEDKTSQVKNTNTLNRLVSCSQNKAEEASFHAKVDTQSLKGLAAKEKQAKHDVAFKTSNPSRINKMKQPSLREENPTDLFNLPRGDVDNEMSVARSNTPSDPGVSSAIPMGRPSQEGKGRQQDGCCTLLASSRVQVFDDESDCGSIPILTGQGYRDVSVGKENQSPKHFPAMKDNAKPLAADKRISEVREGEVLTNSSISPSTDVDMIHNHGGTQRVSLCLPSRTKSLKLTRAKLDLNPPQATKVGQMLPVEMARSIPVEKQQTVQAEKWSSPIVIPDVPTVVISDSGSDSELSDEGFTLSLTQRNLCSKRKAISKLR